MTSRKPRVTSSCDVWTAPEYVIGMQDNNYHVLREMLSGIRSESSDELVTACAHPHRNAQHERHLVTLQHINQPILSLGHK